MTGACVWGPRCKTLEYLGIIKHHFIFESRNNKKKLAVLAKMPQMCKAQFYDKNSAIISNTYSAFSKQSIFKLRFTQKNKKNKCNNTQQSHLVHPSTSRSPAWKLILTWNCLAVLTCRGLTTVQQIKMELPQRTNTCWLWKPCDLW